MLAARLVRQLARRHVTKHRPTPSTASCTRALCSGSTKSSMPMARAHSGTYLAGKSHALAQVRSAGWVRVAQRCASTSSTPTPPGGEFGMGSADDAREQIEKMRESLGDLGVDPDARPRETKDAPAATEEVVDAGQSHTFQAETRRILDIMSKSLYTQREVFLRELISNASDALEKVRYLQQQQRDVVDSDKPLEIHINVDEDKGLLTIQDFGVGMNRDELVENLGTIARSGSKAFMQSLDEQQPAADATGAFGGGADAASSIIGQFGVGFYSVFMVANKVDVFSSSATPSEDGEAADGTGHYWTSDGSGEYQLGRAKGVNRGTKIVLHLNEDAKEFADKLAIEKVIKKYSNFVGFPIFLNGEKVNTVDALWLRGKDEVTGEEHREFYKFIANSWDFPAFTLHFRTDVPIDIKALLYVPERHMEKFGFGRMEPGVSLYCRKVLIQGKTSALLPDWLRFMRGVVDSEDVPLNISRENLQDSALVRRINSFLTKRVIKFLDQKAQDDPDAYIEWYKEFNMFLKEGVTMDFTHKNNIAKLLRYETSNTEDGSLHSLDDYVARCAPGQDSIYFVVAANREEAESSPYYEAFKRENKEVLFFYQQIDEFVVKSLSEYSKRKFISIESTEAAKGLDNKAGDGDSELEKKAAGELVEWMTHALHDKVSEINVSQRPLTTPAIVVDHESAAVRSMMNYVNQDYSKLLPKQKLEINPRHPIMLQLHANRYTNPDLAKLVAEQVHDNALISANIMDNPRSMVPRLNELLEATLNGLQGKSSTTSTTSDKEEKPQS